MRARCKTAPPKWDQSIKQTEKRVLAQIRVIILPDALLNDLKGAVLLVARMCRPTDSARGLSTYCMKATDQSVKLRASSPSDFVLPVSAKLQRGPSGFSGHAVALSEGGLAARQMAGAIWGGHMPSPDVSWRRDALVA